MDSSCEDTSDIRVKYVVFDGNFGSSWTITSIWRHILFFRKFPTFTPNMSCHNKAVSFTRYQNLRYFIEFLLQFLVGNTPKAPDENRRRSSRYVYGIDSNRTCWSPFDWTKNDHFGLLLTWPRMWFFQQTRQLSSIDSRSFVSLSFFDELRHSLLFTGKKKGYPGATHLLWCTDTFPHQDLALTSRYR